VADDRLSRDELRAVIDARRELGPEYEPALVESFLDKLEDGIAAKVRAEVDARVPERQQARGRSDPSLTMAMGSLALGIPLTGIAAGNGGLTGLLIAWGGIVAVNAVHALNRRRRDRR
jgi:hypothetical protein